MRQIFARALDHAKGKLVSTKPKTRELQQATDTFSQMQIHFAVVVRDLFYFFSSFFFFFWHTHVSSQERKKESQSRTEMKCERTRSTRTAEREKERGRGGGRGRSDRRQENNKVKMVTLTCTWAAKEEEETEAEEDEPEEEEEENCDRRLSGREAHRENIRYFVYIVREEARPSVQRSREKGRERGLTAPERKNGNGGEGEWQEKWGVARSWAMND